MKKNRGSSLIEVTCGMLFLIPIVLSMIDLSMIFVAASANSSVCNEIVSALASNAYKIKTQPELQSIAASVIQKFAMPSTYFQIRPNCSISEMLDAVAYGKAEGPLDATVSVESVVDVHPPFIVGAVLGKKGIALKSTHAKRFSYFLPRAPVEQTPEPNQEMWQITITCQLLDNFLTGFNPKWHPVSEALVSCAIEGCPQIDCKKIYYANTNVLGSVALHALNIREGSQGCIYITNPHQQRVLSAPENEALCHAAANSCLRMYLQVCANRCLVNQIVVQRSMFDEVIQSFLNLGFQRLRPGENHEQVNLVLRVMSDDKNLFQYLTF